MRHTAKYGEKITSIPIEEALDPVKEELLAPHRYESLGLPTVEYVGDVEAGIVEQSGEVFHLHTQYLGASRRSTEAVDEVYEPSFELLGRDAPHALVQLLGPRAELVEEVHAEYLVRVEHTIQVLLVDGEKRYLALCHVGGLVAGAAAEEGVGLYHHRRVVYLHEREGAVGCHGLGRQLAPEEECQLGARLALREDGAPRLHLHEVELGSLDDFGQLGTAHPLKQGKLQQRVIHCVFHRGRHLQIQRYI